MDLTFAIELLIIFITFFMLINASAEAGRRSSFISSLMTSANGCSNPSGPTRLGPGRSWM